MAGQDKRTGAVDPRPEEQETGAKTGQAAPSGPRTDAAGSDLAAISGSAPAPSPASGNSQETHSSDSSKTEAKAREKVDALIEQHGTTRDGRNAIVDVNAGVRSVANTSAMVSKAETQSVDMQTGAQVAHDNAVQSMVKRFQTLCAHVGQDATKEIAKVVGKLHNIEEVVKNALKQAGVID